VLTTCRQVTPAYDVGYEQAPGRAWLEEAQMRPFMIVVACAALPGATLESQDVRDSAGIRIVTHPASAGPKAWRLIRVLRDRRR
jgi:hypothetical protein